MKYSRILLFVVLAAGILLLFANVDVAAQCSMCRASLTSSSNSRFIRGLNLGVLVLLVPPVTIFCSIFVVLRRYRGNG
ncbi:MAG TPA: hypothetical protein VHH35_05520 [Pyrinomonadaceae bacterium]|nr:hypothetical protein [Pyrinomonadaceae bacterium]